MLQLPSELTWLDAREVLSLSDLSCVCALSVDDLAELVDYGALVPLAPAPSERQFSAQCVTQLRAACQLRVDYDLDLFTVAMVMGYLTRIEALEHDLRLVRACLPHHLPDPLAQPRQDFA